MVFHRLPLVASLILAAPALLANVGVPDTAEVPSDEPPAIPEPIRAMLDAAIAAGSEGEVATIVKYARAADPASGDAVARLAQDWRDERARARQTRIERASMFDLWTGRAELGGFVSTGNSDITGLTGIVDLTREGLEWRHKIRAQADFQRSLNQTTREHYVASYQPNWKVDDRRYVYGAAQFESDRFFGYTERYSASVGAGYSAVRSPAVSLNLELGPAYRHTEFTDARTESSIAARGSVDLDWKLSPGVTLTHDASAYVQHYNSTVTATSALAARLVGPLSAQVSYTVQYESMPPIGRVSTDTTSRASLVYTF